MSLRVRPHVSIVKECHTTSKRALTDEFEVKSSVTGQCGLAATQGNGHQEKLALVYETSPECVGGQVGPATAMSRSTLDFISWITAGSNTRSICVLALDAVASDVEYTIF